MTHRKDFLKGILALACIPMQAISSNMLKFKPTKFDDVKNEYYEQAASIVKQKSFEQNTPKLRRDVETALLDHFYNFMRDHNVAIYENAVICDETNNTAKTIDNNELHVMIGIKEHPRAKYVIVNLVALRTNSKFTYI